MANSQFWSQIFNELANAIIFKHIPTKPNNISILFLIGYKMGFQPIEIIWFMMDFWFGSEIYS